MCITPLLYYFSAKNEMITVGIKKIRLRITLNLFTFKKDLFFSL